MNLVKKGKGLLVCTATILVVFVAVSFLDIIIAVLYARFYSNAAFIVTFGVGGIFAAVFGYMNGISAMDVQDEQSRWTLIIFMLIMGLVFFFPLARLEGGEYEAAFKGFGATLSMAGFLFAKGKIE
jgi:membrane-bound acyltransferase YfiQ involved in biofilm formation